MPEQYVTTFQAPNGDTLTVCEEHGMAIYCTRTEAGEYYCAVSHGTHSGLCDLCLDEE